MMLAIMIIGIVGWIETGNYLFLSTAILGGLLLGFNWTAVLVHCSKED